MTLVLRYIDRTRYVAVADTRVTEWNEDDTIRCTYDGGPSKAFTVENCLVTFSGLTSLNYYSGNELTTRQWVSAALRESIAEDKDLKSALADMASLLSGPMIIDPKMMPTSLDIRVMGVSDAPPDFITPETEDGDAGEFWDDDDPRKPRYGIVFAGYITNVDGKWWSASFDSDAYHYVPPEDENYTSHGAKLPDQTRARLDEYIHEAASTIDIVNHFVAAIRETADAVGDGTVGRKTTATVAPLQELANAIATRVLRFSERTDGQLADGYVCHTVIDEQLAGATMVPSGQVNFVVSDASPSEGGFVG